MENKPTAEAIGERVRVILASLIQLYQVRANLFATEAGSLRDELLVGNEQLILAGEGTLGLLRYVASQRGEDVV